MHSISNETRINRKIDNWQQISKLIKKKDINVKLEDINDLIINKNNETLKFLRELYTAVTERKYSNQGFLNHLYYIQKIQEQHNKKAIY